jgi:hypothetical protein
MHLKGGCGDLESVDGKGRQVVLLVPELAASLRADPPLNLLVTLAVGRLEHVCPTQK